MPLWRTRPRKPYDPETCCRCRQPIPLDAMFMPVNGRAMHAQCWAERKAEIDAEKLSIPPPPPTHGRGRVIRSTRGLS